MITPSHSDAFSHRAADAEARVSALNAELASARAEVAAAKAELVAVKAELAAAQRAAKEAMEDVSMVFLFLFNACSPPYLAHPPDVPLPPTPTGATSH